MRIVEPYDRSKPTKLIEIMLLKAIVDPAAIHAKQNVTMKMVRRAFFESPVL